MNVVSLYSGADNLGDGVIHAGHTIKLAVDKDADCCKTIKLNHPDIEVICGKVSDHLESLPKCDALVGGPPCQGFSTANMNRDLDLTEIDNFKKAREVTKCRYYFMENVRGISTVLGDGDYGIAKWSNKKDQKHSIAVIDKLTSCGFIVLRNSEFETDDVIIYGVDEFAGDEENYKRSSKFTVVISHRKSLETCFPSGNLYLFAHMHGFEKIIPKKYLEKLDIIASEFESEIITSGLGLPRISKPEIVLIDLKR